MQNYENRMLRVLQYIHDNPAGDLSLDRLADEAAMSRFHWHRVFRAMTGETCAQAVRRVRLHRAANMLLLEDRPVSEIAAAVGYDNARSFARAFEAQYGLSPALFRQKGKQLPPLLAAQKGARPMYDVSIREEGLRVIAGVTHKGPYFKIGAAFERFFFLCQSRNLWPRLGRPVGIYFHNPECTPEEDLRSMAGAELRVEDVPDGLDGHKIAAGRYAVLTYRGPYTGIAAGYDRLFGQWLPESGELPADAPCFEVYLNDPREVSEDDLLTEIHLPLADKDNG